MEKKNSKVFFGQSINPTWWDHWWSFL